MRRFRNLPESTIKFYKVGSTWKSTFLFFPPLLPFDSSRGSSRYFVFDPDRENAIWREGTAILDTQGQYYDGTKFLRFGNVNFVVKSVVCTTFVTFFLMDNGDVYFCGLLK